jgi:hypothetical protein
VAEYNDKIKRLVTQFKEEIDLHELADWLGLVRPGKTRGNYRSPHRPDAQPSVGIFKDGRAFTDYTTGDGGSCIDLVMYVRHVDQWEAIKTLCQFRNVPVPRPDDTGPKPERTKEEFIADQCLRQADLVLPYLVEQRKIPEKIVRASIKARMLGFNTWASDKIPAGEPMHGGPAAAFIVRTLNPGHVAAVDMRYVDPALNGGLKTQTQGQKAGIPWLPYGIRSMREVKTVYIVESPINALSIEACDLPYTQAIAVRGVNVEAHDWGWLRGKQCVICMDADKPDEKTHRRPGPEAGWALYDLLAARNIAAHVVDQADWYKKELNDVNEILQKEGPDELKMRLRRFEDNTIIGVYGRDGVPGTKRVFLPAYDFAQYWKFKAQTDYTDYVAKTEDIKDSAGNPERDEDGNPKRKLTREPLAGFRVAALSRVTIQSERSTFSGVEDHSPTVQFAATVQLPRHGSQLKRRVFRDEDLHKIARWEEFGPVYDPKNFRRLLTILERTVHFGSRKAANFVGVCWLDGKLIVNEGSDCYFERPEKQCHYHEHSFHRGPQSDARVVIEAYQKTFKNNAAVLPLIWILGGTALKCILQFWPHHEMQAKKGSGKSTLIGWLSGTTGFTMFSNEQMKTSYRLISSVGHSSLPVGWEEVSKAGKFALRDAITMLQESYQFAPHTRGSENLRYLNSAPVLLAGEDVPAQDLTGKLVRTRLTLDRQGAPIDQNLVPFPMRRWLEWVAQQDPDAILARYERCVEHCHKNSRAEVNDAGGKRMAKNYAALLLAWKLLAEFAGVEEETGGLPKDLLAEMNEHISETKHDREPYIWILEKLASEIARGEFSYPYAWEEVAPPALGDREMCLAVRAKYVMDHMSGSTHLRDFYDSLPVKSDRVFKQQCIDAGLVVNPDYSTTIKRQREEHILALSVARMGAMGIHMPVKEQDPEGDWPPAPRY